MFRRCHRIIIALLLATLPVMGLAAFVREGQSACTMHMGTAMHGKHAVNMSEHCKAMQSAVHQDCKRGAHCAMCDDLSTSMAVTALPVLPSAAAQGITLEPADFLLDPTVAALWRPPRSV